MPGNESSETPFLLGITMAGAVSAGAYTAGVLDFLFRALDAHNARVAGGATAEDEDPPRHRVALKVLSGASAGGVCAGLGMAGLIKSQQPGQPRLRAPTPVETEPLEIKPGENHSYHYDYVLDTLHDVWVTGLDLWRGESQQGFLATDDLREKGRPIQSVLNSRHIDDVGDRALERIPWGRDGSPGQPYSFLADEVDLFLTTTDLMGIPYEVRFTSTGGQQASAGHKMAQHSAIRHFRIAGLGEHAARSYWLDRWGDDGIPLPLPDHPGGVIEFDDGNTPWVALKIASFATGAFPAGLAPRLIEAEAQDFTRVSGAKRSRGGALPIEIDPQKSMHAAPEFGAGTTPETKVRYVAVDGGMINNEPFEYARFTLRPKARDKSKFLDANPRDAEAADRAVLMIDPFPEGPEYAALSEEEARTEVGLLASLTRLVSTLKDQARFKPAELINAAKGEVHSRFLVAPSRRPDAARSGGTAPEPIERVPLAGAEAIASGGLGGFLGFADSSFRVHDFVLGQRNCQSFLREHFTLAGSNPVLKLPDGHPEKTKAARRRVIDPGDDMLETTIELPPWPRIGNERLRLLLRQAESRFDALGGRLLQEIPMGGLLTWVLRRVWGGLGPIGGGRERISAQLSKIVLGELVARDQHVDFHGLSEEMRKVLIALIDRGSEPATAGELIDRVRERDKGAGALDAVEVERTLNRLTDKGQLWRTPARGQKRRYTHALFKPGRWTRMRLFFGV